MNFLHNLKRVVVLLCSFFLAGNTSLTPLNFAERDGTDANKAYFLITTAKLKSLTSFYDLLGINETATEADIKKAYRKLCLLFHPDGKETRYPSFEERFEKKKEFVTLSFEEMFKHISSANQTLSDDATRRAYDRRSPEDKASQIKALTATLLILAKKYEGIVPSDEHTEEIPTKPSRAPKPASASPASPKKPAPSFTPPPSRPAPQKSSKSPAESHKPTTPQRQSSPPAAAQQDPSEFEKKPKPNSPRPSTTRTPQPAPKPSYGAGTDAQKKTTEQDTALNRERLRQERKRLQQKVDELRKKSGGDHADSVRTQRMDETFLGAKASVAAAKPTRRIPSSGTLPRATRLTQEETPLTKPQDKLRMKLCDKIHTVVRDGIIYSPGRMAGDIPAKPNDWILNRENISLLPLTTDEQRLLCYELLRIGFLPGEILPAGTKHMEILQQNLTAAGRKMNYFTYLPHINAACQKGSVSEELDVPKNVLRFFLKQRAELLTVQNNRMRIDMREHRNLIRAIDLLDAQTEPQKS